MGSVPQRFTWSAIIVVALSLLYAVLEIGFTRPYLPATYDGGFVAARPPADAANRLEAWRAEYRGRVELSPTPVWRSNHKAQWARRHVGMIVQVLVFTICALVLFILRSNDLTAGLAVMALALSAVAGGGPLFGVEYVIPFQLGSVLTVFAWIAGPLAFPIIALAILYFPARSPLLAKYPFLRAVPFIVALPMLVAGAGTGLYLSGVDAARAIALWDALNPGTYFVAFAGALAINLAVIIEGLYRYRFNHDANERRRIRMAVYTAVPGVAAYAVKDGAPVIAELAGKTLAFSDGLTILLQALVLLPAFGLVYAVGVERVLGPRTVLRRSLQYALASRTLTIAAILPMAALFIVLVRKSDQTVADVARGSWLLFLVLAAGSFAAFHFRNRARQWLDQRFFREEYDARKILLSLASRVRFETDPADLSSMVVESIDAALHPQTTAILVSGIEEGVLTPVTILHGSAESLPLEGGIVSMLRWSDEPLELFLQDPRSPARRLPSEEQDWLHCTGARLLVPVIGRDRALIAVIAIGEKRSEEAYTAEDRQLLASIAAQMGLGFDVARLRRRAESQRDTMTAPTHIVATAGSLPMVECPRCGRCEESGVAVCSSDGVPMQPVPGVPRIVDNKYRIEQLIGRGGMGAVYRARDVRLNRFVAVKVVRAELLGDADARRRFRREAQIIARLQHPAIVSIFDFGTFPDGGAYLVMELVRGEDLRHVLQREGRLDPQRALPILSAVCGGIEAAHREGVLHRDLKPENILLPGGDVEAKVLDFGVAKVLDDRQGSPVADPSTMVTAADIIVGTPAYMAPEQLRAGKVDARTDVFSLGVIAYEMLTGELPFGRGSLADVVLAHSRGVPAMHGVPATLDRAIRTALQAEPDRRPASPQAFAHLIAAAAAM